MKAIMSLRSFRNLTNYPAGQTLSAESILEFHAARLLLLLHICGRNGELEGLTKLAKLDFFVRYPSFFARACRHLKKPVPQVPETIEAAMVRHHYGPWDHRYYHVLSFLEGANLVQVRKTGGSAYHFTLTKTGAATAQRIGAQPAFAEMIQLMRQVRSVLGPRNGENLKQLIYFLFDAEVADRPLGEVIR